MRERARSISCGSLHTLRLPHSEYKEDGSESIHHWSLADSKRKKTLFVILNAGWSQGPYIKGGNDNNTNYTQLVLHRERSDLHFKGTGEYPRREEEEESKKPRRKSKKS